GVAYQHEQPATTRATLAVFFGLGSIISFSGLAAVGEVDQRHISLCLLLLPGVLVGLALSRPVTSRFPEHRLRIALLTTCSFSAIFLLIETAIEMLG
ncbi:MAG: TSUP family transporter, partial [Actinomycetota bacterium]|nr:TSUP family transporter [Actinomycetota bacterium]